jgi:hypothetical protein
MKSLVVAAACGTSGRIRLMFLTSAPLIKIHANLSRLDGWTKVDRVNERYSRGDLVVEGLKWR